MKGWPMEDEEDSLILMQIGEANFLILIGEAYFLNLIMVRKEGTQALMSIEWKLRFLLLVEP